MVGVGQFHPAYRPYDQFSDSEMDFDTRVDFDTKNDQSEKSFDPALFDVTRIPVDDFANQITLDDFEIFKKITPEEVILIFKFFFVIFFNYLRKFSLILSCMLVLSHEVHPLNL